MNLLAVLDNDGTICDTQAVKGFGYAQAIQRVTSQLLSMLDWTTDEELMSSGIVEDS